MEVDTVLVPIDDTRSAMDAVEYGVAIADRYDASVHALYLLGENAAASMANGAIEASAIAERAEQIMASVRAMAGEVPVDHSSACGFSVDRLNQHPGSVILDVAEMLEVGFIVVPREPTAEETDAVIQKAAEYVLKYASQPVLSV